MERSEAQAVTRDPVVVRLCGEEVRVPPLTVRRSREWREKLSALAEKVVPLVEASTEDPSAFASAVKSILVDFPDDVLDTLCAYDPELFVREKIEEEAYDDEVLTAFTTLCSFVLTPFFVAAGAVRSAATTAKR